jgi:hypothetical protein
MQIHYHIRESLGKYFYRFHTEILCGSGTAFAADKKGVLQNNSNSRKQTIMSVGEGLAPPAHGRPEPRKNVRRFRKMLRFRRTLFFYGCVVLPGGAYP